MDLHRLRPPLHPTAGTIFHRSSTSLRLWFHAMYLMTSTRCGISAKQLERELGRPLQDRLAHVQQDPQRVDGRRRRAAARGKVEVDETSWGGKPRRKLKTRREARCLPRSQGDGAGDGRARRAGPAARHRRRGEASRLVEPCGRTSTRTRSSSRTIGGLQAALAASTQTTG